MIVTNKKKEPFIHIVKRSDMPTWKAWLVRGIAILVAFLISGLMCLILTKGKEFGDYYLQMFKGAFGTERRTLNLFQEWAMLMCISLAVTPAFKMKFWNIGAEGQTLIGALCSAIISWYLGGKIPEAALIVLMFVAGIIGGAFWGFIPAIFKANWNTNETLFTLMMNYIATQLVLFFTNTWLTNEAGDLSRTSLGELPGGSFAYALGKVYLINVLLVTIVTAILFIYMKYSKHGYELEVVGESVNTAKYVGINVKKVILRTMILSGAICGFAGFLLVGGIPAPTVSDTTVGGRGFTAILVSWLAQFNPIIMIMVALLVVFMQKGAGQAATQFSIGASEAFGNVIVGLFFIILIASEFFVRYKVKIKIKNLGLKAKKEARGA